VEREARRIVEALRLEPDLKQAIIIAARLHDIGKDRRAWQLSIGNRDRNRTLAKSGGRMAPIELTPYRHELGSVLDAPEDPLLADLGDEQRDLVLHLIAAHHGRARPHFPARELFDPEAEGGAVEAEGVRIVERFGRLQKRFGRWGLAYLESLVRAADYAASANPSEVVDP
jgi:CRISPR-associated endonuclease/helicase Cas3